MKSYTMYIFILIFFYEVIKYSNLFKLAKINISVLKKISFLITSNKIFDDQKPNYHTSRGHH